MSEKKKNRIGLVGCGTISRVHAQAIQNLKNGELIAAHSRSDDKRNIFCEEFSINGYANYDDFLADPNLDTVSLCTPNGTHLDYGLKAAEAGKNLIVEKPIEITTERGWQLVDACRKHGVGLAVIFQNRFIDDIRWMKQAVDEGKIGDLVMARASVKWFRDAGYYKNAPWRGSLDLDGGGALINQGIHTVDLLLWFAGQVEQIQAFKGTLTHEGIEGEDAIVASCRFKNGALGVLEASTSIVPAQKQKIELHGSLGTLFMDGNQVHLLTDQDDPDSQKKASGTPGAAAGASSPLAGFSTEPHRRQYEQILQSFKDGTTPVVSGEESMIALSFVRSAYLSAEEGRPVSPDRFLRPGV